MKRQETAVLAMGKKSSSMQADAAVFSQLQAENEALKKEAAGILYRYLCLSRLRERDRLCPYV